MECTHICKISMQRSLLPEEIPVSEDISLGPVEMIQISKYVKVEYFYGCIMSLSLVEINWISRRVLWTKGLLFLGLSTVILC